MSLLDCSGQMRTERIKIRKTKCMRSPRFRGHCRRQYLQKLYTHFRTLNFTYTILWIFIRFVQGAGRRGGGSNDFCKTDTWMQFSKFTDDSRSSIKMYTDWKCWFFMNSLFSLAQEYVGGKSFKSLLLNRQVYAVAKILWHSRWLYLHISGIDVQIFLF